MFKLTPDEKKRLRHGDTELLKAKLQEYDKALVHKLKTSRDGHDVRYWQGASHIIDTMITIYE